jgi:hypothetical protein
MLALPNVSFSLVVPWLNTSRFTPSGDFDLGIGAEQFSPVVVVVTCPSQTQPRTSNILPARYAPGYDIYLWIDADAWVQDSSVIQYFIRGAEKGAAAVSPEVDSAYPFIQHLPSAIQFQRYKFGQWADAFGEDVARRMSLLPLINAGVYAINADPLLWEKWAENFRLTLRKGMTGLCDQVALQKTLVELNRMHALPSRANWMSHYALPHRRAEDGVWIEPRFAGQPIGIMHLVAAVRRESYLRHGMLYDDGDYLSPEEVPENLRAAFLAGRRKPIIGAPPDA